MRITIHVTTRDRHSETALMLQSLRTQTFQEFDLMILDDASGTPLSICGFFDAIVKRIKLEGHYIKMLRNEISQGVCSARNVLIENDTFGNPLTLRLDDDVILQQDYLERLHNMIVERGYDVASGIVPLLAMPAFERENKFIGSVTAMPSLKEEDRFRDSIINEHRLDPEGNLILNKDECGYGYLEEGIYPTHQFRTNALYRSDFNKYFKYPLELSRVGFREELWFSFSAILHGYKLGIDVQAIAYHLHTPSGGCRDPEYTQKVQLDEETTHRWIKRRFVERGDFLADYIQRILL